MDKNKISNFLARFLLAGGQFPISNFSFTFIELLLAVSIVIIFSGLSLASYHLFNQTKKLEAETKKLVETLELARKKIISSDKSNFPTNPINYSGCDLTAYKVVIAPPNQYSLKATVRENGDANCEASGDQDIDTFRYNGPQNIIFSSSGDAVFYPFGKSTSICITIRNTTINKNQYIQVSESGTINTVTSC